MKGWFGWPYSDWLKIVQARPISTFFSPGNAVCLENTWSNKKFSPCQLWTSYRWVSFVHGRGGWEASLNTCSDLQESLKKHDLYRNVLNALSGFWANSLTAQLSWYVIIGLFGSRMQLLIHFIHVSQSQFFGDGRRGGGGTSRRWAEESFGRKK